MSWPPLCATSIGLVWWFGIWMELNSGFNVEQLSIDIVLSDMWNLKHVVRFQPHFQLHGTMKLVSCLKLYIKSEDDSSMGLQPWTLTVMLKILRPDPLLWHPSLVLRKKKRFFLVFFKLLPFSNRNWKCKITQFLQDCPLYLAFCSGFYVLLCLSTTDLDKELQFSSTLFGDDSPHPNPSKKHRDSGTNWELHKGTGESRPAWGP